MAEWTKVITHPLGLAGFALFVVLILLTRHQPATQPTWLKALFSIMAVVALISGIWLTSRETPAGKENAPTPLAKKEVQPTASHSPPMVESTPVVEQTTSEGKSPAIADVKGNVTISIGQSQNSDKEATPPTRGPASPHQKGKQPAKPGAQPEEHKPSRPAVKQQTSGTASPAISGVGGDVTVTITNR